MTEAQALIWIENCMVLCPFRKRRQLRRRWNFLWTLYGCDPRIVAVERHESSGDEHDGRFRAALERAGAVLGKDPVHHPSGTHHRWYL